MLHYVTANYRTASKEVGQQWVSFNFSSNRVFSGLLSDFLAELPEQLADLWLESIANGAMHFYCEQILTIQKLSQHGAKQLTADAGAYSIALSFVYPYFILYPKNSVVNNSLRHFR